LWGERVLRKQRVGKNSNEAGLREWAGCPTSWGVAGKPTANAGVGLVVGPCERDKDIHIKQDGCH
jgi:hypothetical protein